MFDRIKAKQESKELLRSRTFTDAVMFALITLVVPFAALALLSRIPFVGALFILASLVYGVLIQAGINRCALRMHNGDNSFQARDLFSAGDRLGKYIAISFLEGLFIFLWMLPSIVICFVSVGFLMASESEELFGLALDVYLVFHPGWIVFIVVLLIAAVVWLYVISIRKAYQYSLSFWVAEAKHEYSALECIRESSRLTAGHKLNLFVVDLSFIGWTILSSIPFVSVYTIPYRTLTAAAIYKQLVGKPVVAPPVYNVIEILTGEMAGSTVEVNGSDEIIIGRDPARANIVTSPADTSISGLHCSVRFDPQKGKYIVIDYSANGTHVNNIKLERGKGVYADKGSIIMLADNAMLLKLS